MKKFNHGEIVKPALKYKIDKVDYFLFCEIFSSYFYSKLLKNLKTAVSRKLKRFGNSNMEAKVAKPGEVLTASQYLVVNFKLGKINIEFKLKNRKKNLNHCNIRI